MLHSNLSKTIIDFGTFKQTMYFRPGSSDENVLNHVFSSQDYDFSNSSRFREIATLVKEQQRKGLRPLIIDAGANIGAATVFFAGRFAEARIVAIEPEEDNFDLLTRNVEGLDVRCIKGALSSSTGSARVLDNEGDNWAFRTELVGDGTSGLPTVTIGTIYEEEWKKDVFPLIVKIDIEGAEATTFDKNTEWVDKTPILIVELHDWLLPKAGTSRTFLQCICQQDRDFVVDGELVFSFRHDLGS